MGLLYHRTVFNHFVVIELFHDIHLTTSIRNPKFSLKRIPNIFEEIISLALLKLTLISLAFFFSILVIWPTFQFPFGFMAQP
jgi:hypothetical protein